RTRAKARVRLSVRTSAPDVGQACLTSYTFSGANLNKTYGLPCGEPRAFQVDMPRALLLDDEKIERSILQTILTDAGFEVRALPIAEMLPLYGDHDLFDIAVLDLSASMQNESQIVSLCNDLAGTAILIMTDNGTISQALRVGVAT